MNIGPSLHNEDTLFARQLQDRGKEFVFCLDYAVFGRGE